MESCEKNEITVDPVKAEIDKYKPMAILAYLSWLVLIPLFFARKSQFARYHTNQGLVIAIAETIYYLVAKLVVGIVWSFSVSMGVLWETIFFLSGMVFVVLIILGIINVLRDQQKPLPTFGKIKILKDKKNASQV